MKYAAPILLVLLTVCSCKTPAPHPPSELETVPENEHIDETKPGPNLETGPKPKVGGCSNEHLEGTCTFLLLFAQKPVDTDPEGTTVYKVAYSVEEGETKVQLDRLCLRIPSDREADLRKHLKSNSPVKCSAYIVRPPCNPQATSVTPQIDFPDWVTNVRCY